jgi:excisionase family DNA binding protein
VTTALSMREIRNLPATIDATTAAAVLGVSRSTVYEWLRTGAFPGRAISVRHRHRIVTESLIELLEDKKTAGH